MLKYEDRNPKPKKVSEFGSTDKANDDWYDYLINEWIPGQPDFKELMDLFIECGFNPFSFLILLNPTEKNLELLVEHSLKTQEGSRNNAES